MTELEQLRAHLLTLASPAEWLERAASLAAAAELHERAAEAMVARQRYDEARAHRGTAERLRGRQRACEGIAGAVRESVLDHCFPVADQGSLSDQGS